MNPCFGVLLFVAGFFTGSFFCFKKSKKPKAAKFEVKIDPPEPK